MSRSITPEPTPPQTITVPTAAGFNAGDLVYFNGSTGDYGTPTPTTQTDITVTGTKIQPLLGATVGTYSSTVDGIQGSCGTKGFAATLTDANIVQVFINADTNEPSFRVVDAAGTVVVAETSISATYTQTGNANISVAALTGGGFVVAWLNSAGGTVTRPCYAVYDNTGAVVAAAGQDLGGTGIGVVTSAVRVEATPSGGFIIAYYSAASTIINARGYAANGTASFAWVSLSGVTTTGGVIGLAVRSNGDFLLAGQATGNATGLYAIWSSVGAAIVGSTTIPFTNGTSAAGGSFDACCLTNGTTFVIAYTPTIGSITIAFRFLPTGNVLGSEFYIPAANYSNGSGLAVRTILSIAPLTSNRFIVFGSDSTTNRNVVYVVFDSSGVCLSGTSGTTSTAAVPIQVIGSYFVGTGGQVAVFEAASGLINIYWQWDSARTYALNRASISETTYAVTVITPTATAKNIGVTASQPAALYQPSESTPLAAGFSIAPGDYPVSYSFGTIIKAPEQVESANVYHCACATLLDGRIVIAYIAATSLVKVAVYSVDGVLTQTLSIANNGTTNSTNDSSLVDIAAMTGGGFVITYVTTANATFNTYLYSSALVQVGSVITTTGSGTLATSFPRVAGITGNRYVIVYTNNADQPIYEVYDSANTQIVAPVAIAATAHGKMTVAALSNGGFLMSATLSSTGIAWYGTWANPSGNTFSAVKVWGAVGSSNTIVNNKAVSNSSGVAYLPVASTATAYSANSYTTSTGGGQPTNSGSGLNITNSSGGVAVGVTGFGNLINTILNTGPVITVNGVGGNSINLSATTFPVRTGATPKIALASGYGPTFGLIFISSATKLYYAILTDTVTQTATITSADICTPITIYPNTTSASPAIQNTVFTGVALQTVPAGGAGLVQVNGTAQLGSTYPSTTMYQAFDHQGQGVPGVKGTITGRAITLQGT